MNFLDNIDFRLWDKAEKRMKLVVSISFYDDGTVLTQPYGNYSKHLTDNREYAELLRFTGLRDKNDKKIFEGDIIRFCDFASDRTGGHMGDSIITGYVSFDYSLWFVKENEDDENGFLLVDAHLNDDELEVIGNIYETPELLEGQSCT